MARANLIESIEMGEVYTLSDLIEMLDISKVAVIRSIKGVEKTGIMVERHKQYGKPCEYIFKEEIEDDTIPCE